jgi:uncharacterized membrane protein
MPVTPTLVAISSVLGRRLSGRRPVIMVHGAVGAARFASMLFGGLFAGFLVAVLVLELSLRSVDASVYTQVRHVELAGLDVLATATLLPALLATAFLVIADRTRGRIFWLTLTALILLVLAFTVSLLINVPINTEQLTWTVQAPPADWASTRDRWQISHALRTGAAVLAVGCMSAAALVKNTSRLPQASGNATTSVPA